MSLRNIDPTSSSREEILAEISRLEALKNDWYSEEQAIKLSINSMYGGLGNKYFIAFNSDVAETITLQGQDLIKYAKDITNKYFLEIWHLDKDIHKKLGIIGDVRKVNTPVVIYCDTDSLEGDSKLIVDDCELNISDYWAMNEKANGCIVDVKGNEIIEGPTLYQNVANWTEDKKLHLSKVRKIIRHKVTKPKWRMITESGKEVIVTGDHSLMVIRDGLLTEIKPSEINPEKDKVVSVFNGLLKNMVI
jgi:DNA polymerase elongation subunit (family B)